MGSERDSAVYGVVARITKLDWTYAQEEMAVLHGLTVDLDPPTAAWRAEVEVRFLIGGLSEVSARERAAGRLRGFGVTVLALRIEKP